MQTSEAINQSSPSTLCSTHHHYHQTYKAPLTGAQWCRTKLCYHQIMSINQLINGLKT